MIGFNTGLRALRTSQLALQTIGQNVANVNTQGYSRQNTLLSATTPISLQGGFQVGTGVQTDMIRRITDEGLLARIRTQESFFGNAAMQQSSLKEIEGIFGEPGEASISKLLSGFFSSVSTLQSDPADRALRGGLVQGGDALAEGLNLLSARLGEIGNHTYNDVRIRSMEVNRHAQAVAELNVKIGEIEVRGVQANDMRDQRDEHIRQISRFIDTTVLDKNNGNLDVMVGGFLIVSGSRSTDLNTAVDSSGGTILLAGEAESPLNTRSGEIHGLLNMETTRVPGLIASADAIARNMILEVNRLHSTGMPGSGPFSRLRSVNAVVDSDQDNSFGDELLTTAGLPFDITSGDLYVNITNETTGATERTKIAIDPDTDSVNDFLTDLNAINHLAASIDPTGHILITANSGHKFDFSSRLDESPDENNTFGNAGASVTGLLSGPFDFTTSGLGFPQSFTVNVDGGTAVTLDFTAADFANSAAATATEVVTAINADLTAASTGATASVVNGKIKITSNTTGANSTLKINESSQGLPALLGLSTVSQTGGKVEVSITGNYTGTSNKQFRFEAANDGEIGVTANLQVNVYDADNVLVATLDVGQGYTEGEAMEVIEGISVSFGKGTISSTNGDTFSLDALADSDTTDILVAFGINTFFKGSTASDIAVIGDLANNPDLVCAGLRNAAGDSANLDRLLNLRTKSLSDLGNTDLETYYTDALGDLGFEASRMNALVESEQGLLNFLTDQHQSISGVSLDEEMVDMVKFQQSFQAASRYINTVVDLTEILINLGA